MIGQQQAKEKVGRRQGRRRSGQNPQPQESTQGSLRIISNDPLANDGPHLAIWVAEEAKQQALEFFLMASISIPQGIENCVQPRSTPKGGPDTGFLQVSLPKGSDSRFLLPSFFQSVAVGLLDK
jgi:hypothetical protein